MWREHEHAHTLLAAHCVFRSGACVAGSRAKNIDLFAALCQHVLEQVAEQLHGHVFKGQRRAVRQLQQMQTRFKHGQRRDVGCLGRVARKMVGLCSVGFCYEGLEVGRRNVVDIEAENLVGQLRVGELAPGAKRCLTDLRIGFRQIQAAIGRQTTKKNIAE